MVERSLSSLKRWLVFASLSLILWGCQTPPTVESPPQWQGRLAVNVDDASPHHFSANFMLWGDASQGELDLLTPLGTTSARLEWLPQRVSWQHDGRVQYFDRWQDLMQEALGAELPTACLFEWLTGRACQAHGWQVDLSRFEQGKIAAVRTDPTPRVSLRIQLD